MLKYVRVLREGELPPGKSAIIVREGEEIALFNYKGKYHAMCNKCPHKGAPLGEGRIEEGVLICPNHEWRFNLKTGDCPQNPELSVKIYPVRVHKGLVRIGVEDAKGLRKGQAVGKEEYKVPTDLKVNIPTILKPINPDETL
ncbi:MAG: Rieske (2Fe-2S) protein [Nitrospinaceae bacterium]